MHCLHYDIAAYTKMKLSPMAFPGEFVKMVIRLSRQRMITWGASSCWVSSTSGWDGTFLWHHVSRASRSPIVVVKGYGVDMFAGAPFLLNGIVSLM
jgi:hypothetical protein